MAEETLQEATSEAIDLKRFLSSMRLNADIEAPVPAIKEGLELEGSSLREEDRFLSGLAAMLLNIDTASANKFDKAAVLSVIGRIDAIVTAQVNEVLHHPKFQALESSWRGLDDLIRSTNFRANIMIDILDVNKDELLQDFDSNAVDITGSALFKKLYIAEYDQYGGKPYGGIVGLYEFKHTPTDEFWLKIMSKVAAASHAPFLSLIHLHFLGFT